MSLHGTQGEEASESEGSDMSAAQLSSRAIPREELSRLLQTTR